MRICSYYTTFHDDHHNNIKTTEESHIFNVLFCADFAHMISCSPALFLMRSDN